MDITDIPDQIAKAFKYSLRSTGAFLLSLLTAMLVFGIGYDLMYGFLFERRYNVKEPHYAWPYFAGLAVVALGIPLGIGLVAYLRARAQARPFKAGQIGIAIAPFEVFSVAPETLGTANVLQALDIVSTQFFHVVQNTMNEFELAREFEFRFLPPYTSITNKQQAVAQQATLGATLVVWGSITQRSKEPLDVRFTMQSAKETYAFSDLTIEQFPMLPLQFFTFLEAAKAVQKLGDAVRARGLFEQARSLAAKLDTKIGGAGYVGMVDGFLASLAAGI